MSKVRVGALTCELETLVFDFERVRRRGAVDVEGSLRFSAVDVEGPAWNAGCRGCGCTEGLDACGAWPPPPPRLSVPKPCPLPVSLGAEGGMAERTVTDPPLAVALLDAENLLRISSARVLSPALLGSVGATGGGACCSWLRACACSDTASTPSCLNWHCAPNLQCPWAKKWHGVWLRSAAAGTAGVATTLPAPMNCGAGVNIR